MSVPDDLLEWLRRDAANNSSTVDERVDHHLRPIMEASKRVHISFACGGDMHTSCPKTISPTFNCGCECHGGQLDT